MFTHTTAMDHQSIFLTHTTWSNSSKPLVQNRFHHTTNHFPDLEEDFCSCSCTLDQSTPFPDLVDGNTMTGSELWSGITSSLLPSTLDSSRPDISHSSSVQSSQYSIMSTPTTNSNKWQMSGPIALSCNKMLIWDTPKNNWNITELIKNMNSSRRGLLWISFTTPNSMLMLISTKDAYQCWTKSKTLRMPISRMNWNKSLMLPCMTYSPSLMMQNKQFPSRDQH